MLDCVGPLPKTKKGNEYLLTLMDPTTRYPAAFPLKNISAKNIVNHPLQFFTMVGIPSEIQTDQGSNFTSHLFEQVMKDLSVHHVTSSAYHPVTGLYRAFSTNFKVRVKEILS